MAEWFMGNEMSGTYESTTKGENICHNPHKMNSNGFWDATDIDDTFKFSVPLMAFQLSAVFFVSQIVAFLLRPFKQPAVVSQIIGGILLGPTLLGRVDSRIDPFRYSSFDSLASLSTLGFMFFQFLVGVKMDPSIIRTSGKKAMTIGILALVFPLVWATYSSILLRYLLDMDPTARRMVYYVGAANSMTEFPVIATLLTELKILNSELGRLALSSAMICDLSNTFVSLTTTSFKVGEGEILKSLWAILSCAAYVIVVVFIVRPALFWVIRNTPEGEPVKEIYIIIILVVAMISGIISVAIGQHVLLGPFILGLAIPDGPPLGSALVQRLDSIVSGLLVPLFLTTSGLRTNLKSITLTTKSLAMFVFMILLSLVAKFTATMLPCLYCKMPFRDSLSLSLIMNAKGIIEMLTYNTWMDNKVIDDEIFSIMVVTVVLAAGTISPIVGALYDPSRKYAGYRKRNILHSRRDAVLRIISCINEEENVPTTIKLLEISNASRESPIHVHVIHLLELVGRASPLLISHQLQRRTSSSPSRSESIINAFRYFEQQHKDVVNVQAFTAIAPIESMHEDICTLALDKGTSLIIIPFHKRLGANGTMDLGQNAMRNLNKNVLDRAPCSVAILIDRWNVGGSIHVLPMQAVYRVGMLFLGDADDREALAYANRMAEDPSVKLTVVRLIPSSGVHGLESERILDDMVVKDFRLNTMRNTGVEYREEVVRDGEHTASIILAMEEANDLILVGRRHSMDSPLVFGLSEWNEYPELGVIGDVLASSDIHNRVSILVVQQQAILD
ncbi:hypothetical protein HHK36_001443 [Tetracentron sinense]|uniref:Uncharacterized protein n=1 Tax=Tetracentron sinense TaxID=13715 RepID=A0A834ZU29_TETSI|nr:hypothetical protein HHK36_001443 [Tetracentron sinense]